MYCYGHSTCAVLTSLWIAGGRHVCCRFVVQVVLLCASVDLFGKKEPSNDVLDLHLTHCWHMAAGDIGVVRGIRRATNPNTS